MKNEVKGIRHKFNDILLRATEPGITKQELNEIAGIMNDASVRVLKVKRVFKRFDIERVEP